tara:strand:- start:693 stop:1316 length:624 start_codon:yes stop_codon:yes gene_type:complete
MAKARINIVTSQKQISAEVNKTLTKMANKALAKSAVKIRKGAYPIIRNAIIDSSEIQSLKSGALKAEFGLESDITSELVDTIMASLDVVVTKVRGGKFARSGSVAIVIQPSDYSNLLSRGFASQLTEDGTRLPWLSWLLTLGDRIIVADFGVEFGDFGRSGGGKMTKQTKPYKVNSQFSGTTNNNFITRAIASATPTIQKMLKNSIK